jgi:hypothetical protein
MMMKKYPTVNSLIKALINQPRMRVTVGLTGDVTPMVMQKALESSFICKATFWGFDNDNNNIVEIKSVYA